MDRLTLADQQKVRKMSDERLRAKLVDVGHDKTDIELTEREELLDLFAKLLAQSQTHVSVSEQETTAKGDDYPLPGWTGGHTDLDREAFEFEKMKWADEMKKWEAEEKQKEFERQKWEAEWQESHQKWETEERRKDAEREERDRKWEAEREDRKAELRPKEAEGGRRRPNWG